MNNKTQNIIYQNKEKIEPVYIGNYICLAFSSNNRFLKYVSVMIESIIENSRNGQNYDLVILHSDISIDNMVKISSMIKNKINFSIRFVNINYFVKDKKYYIETKDKRLTEETYFRIYLLDILSSKYDKVVYLDGDMVTKKDIYQLNEINIKGYFIAAVRDFLGIATSYKNTPFGKERKSNRINIVKITNLDDYFLAGLLIINLNEIRKSYDSLAIEKIATKRNWIQHDQDVLNHICRNNKAKFIDPKWNVLHDYGDIKYLPKYLLDQYRDSEKDPYIIHYGGSKKPWKGETSREISFWKYAFKTPYLSEIIDENILYLMNRKNINNAFFNTIEYNKISDNQLINEYISDMIKSDHCLKNNTELNENEKQEQLLSIYSRIIIFSKYFKYADKEKNILYAVDIYNRIKNFRNQAIHHYKNTFISYEEKIEEFCIFLKSNKKLICTQKIIGHIGKIEYELLMKGTYLSWVLSFVPHFYYIVKERFKSN